MTEQEALTKWCPFSRVAQIGGAGSANRNQVYDEKGLAGGIVGSTCVGSACMAWRWKPFMADESYKKAVIKAASDIGDKSDNKLKAAKHVNENRAAYGLPVDPVEGYCGLAGAQ